MDFDPPAEYVKNIGLLDIDYEATITILLNNEDEREIAIPLLGDNSYQLLALGDENVKQLKFTASRSGAVASLTFCYPPGTGPVPTPSVTPTPSTEPGPTPGTSPTPSGVPEPTPGSAPESTPSVTPTASVPTPSTEPKPTPGVTPTPGSTPPPPTKASPTPAPGATCEETYGDVRRLYNREHCKLLYV